MNLTDRVNPNLAIKQPVIEGLDIFRAQIPDFDLTKVGNDVRPDELFIMSPSATPFGCFCTGQPACIETLPAQFLCLPGSSHHQSGRGSFLTIPGTPVAY